jgi:dihydrofolate synthase/folylpolyglutamate synthase
VKQNTTDNLAWLYQLRGSQVRPGLERIQTFLRHLGLLPLPFDVIHIAGTNGKGSTANYVFSILTSHGINCGLYTSPHLVRFNERIRSAAGMIDDAFIEEFIDQHRGHIEASEITFFEATTAMALAWFRHCRLQVAILETGLGGRLDATNICQPVLTGMTRIAMDHMHLLGTTLEEIAREKLGIVKNGIPLYSVPQAASLGELFRTHCKAQGAALGFIRPDNIRGNAPSLTFSLGGRDWQLAMQGRHQAENAALALTLARHYLA